MVKASNAPARRRRRRKLFAAAKGFRGERKNIYRVARNAVYKARQHAYADRRRQRRDLKRLWIARINAAARPMGLPYNRLIHGLAAAGVQVDRRALAELAVKEPASFAALVAEAKRALPSEQRAV